MDTKLNLFLFLLDQETKLAYNGIEVTKEALSVTRTSENRMPTLDHWHQNGGLVARGVLIDFVRSKYKVIIV